MPEKIRLNNGFVFNNSNAILTGDLFLYIRDGRDLKAVFDLLIDPEKTKKIVYTQANGEPVTFVGYKKLIAVRDEGNGLITAILRKEVGE